MSAKYFNIRFIREPIIQVRKYTTPVLGLAFTSLINFQISLNIIEVNTN